MDVATNRELLAAAAALKDGDFGGALAIIEPLVAASPQSPQLWMALADTRRRSGDMAGFETATDQLIAVEPMAVRGYGWKGDCRLAAGDRRAAAGWYREGVRRAAALATRPPGLEEDIARQQAELDALEQSFAKELHDGLTQQGIDAPRISDRFDESVAILNGQAAVHLQRPGVYYFPGLVQRAFFERDEFDWVAEVEAETTVIADELAAALAQRNDFTPYLKADPDRPWRDTHGMTGNPDWSSIELTVAGQPTEASRTAFPRTWAMLERLPLCRIGSRAPTPMFSLLKADARIPPHHGSINTRLICHLPLVVPGNGALRVGNHTRSWERGKLLIFDDSFEHEAWNDADSDRIVLIFDVWRPELTAAERDAVVALFNVVDGAR